jgi:hypothetical protein
MTGDEAQRSIRTFYDAVFGYGLTPEAGKGMHQKTDGDSP